MSVLVSLSVCLFVSNITLCACACSCMHTDLPKYTLMVYSSLLNHHQLSYDVVIIRPQSVEDSSSLQDYSATLYASSTLTINWIWVVKIIRGQLWAQTHDTALFLACTRSQHNTATLLLKHWLCSQVSTVSLRLLATVAVQKYSPNEGETYIHPKQ